MAPPLYFANMPNIANKEIKTLVVIGGGAAGIFCAVNAAANNKHLKVVVVEKSSKLLSKVKVSGGGRCNVTHALFDIAEMSKRYPRGQHFVKKTFHQFFTSDTIQWFEAKGVKLKTEKDGRMFPVTDSSQTIIDCLIMEANKNNVEILMNTDVKELIKESTGFSLMLSSGKSISAHYVCIASGGYPKSSMFEWLRKLGHTVADPVPSLFTFNLPKHPITALMGVSVDKVKVKIEGSKLAEEGPVLITHWGLSGPAILRLSAWGARELADKNYQFAVHLNWLPQYNEQSLKNEFQNFRRFDATKKMINHKFELFPNRLWLFFLQLSEVKEDTRWADLTSKSENLLIKNLVDFVVTVTGKTTFKEEFVTAGGINLAEIDANSMMSKLVPELYFAGEIMNVDGITGGFNFQNAWTTAWIAAKNIAANAEV